MAIHLLRTSVLLVLTTVCCSPLRADEAKKDKPAAKKDTMIAGKSEV